MTTRAVSLGLDDVAARIEPNAVRVGKDVVELITSGMYVSPITIFREYVQNAADAADDARAAGLLGPQEHGRVAVTLDHRSRSVVVRDDGMGIGMDKVAGILLAVGGSSKRGTRARGFRGVGRLSGLAYCRELEFQTKTRGERWVSTVVWDCRKLRTRLADSSFTGDLRHIVAEAATLRREPTTDVDGHFFEVRMSDVARHRQDLLLNERAVSHYLSQVAPVPFSSEFSFGPAIVERLSGLGAGPPVDLTVNGEPVEKLYRDELVLAGTTNKLTIRTLEWTDFADVDGEVGATAWLGHHDYVRSIPVALGVRGIRARIGEVQVGEAGLLDECFREPRFNGWSMGELHIFDRRVVPNARRDNFEINNHSYNLVAQLGPLAHQVSALCRSSSVSRNVEAIVRNTVADADERTGDGQSLDSAQVARLRAAVMRCRGKLKAVADAETRGVLASELARVEDVLAHLPVIVGAATLPLDEVLSLVSKVVTNRDQARRLIGELRAICAIPEPTPS